MIFSFRLVALKTIPDRLLRKKSNFLHSSLSEIKKDTVVAGNVGSTSYQGL